MKIIQFDTNTFDEIEVEVEEFQYEMAKKIKQVLDKYVVMPQFSLDIDSTSYIASVSEVIASIDNEKLVIGFMKPRVFGEPSERYKITIEKLKNV